MLLEETKLAVKITEAREVSIAGSATLLTRKIPCLTTI